MNACPLWTPRSHGRLRMHDGLGPLRLQYKTAALFCYFPVAWIRGLGIHSGHRATTCKAHMLDCAYTARASAAGLPKLKLGLLLGCARACHWSCSTRECEKNCLLIGSDRLTDAILSAYAQAASLGGPARHTHGDGRAFECLLEQRPESEWLALVQCVWLTNSALLKASLSLERACKIQKS